MPTEVRTPIWKKEYYEIVRGILSCLKLAWLAVEALSNHDATLLSKNRILLWAECFKKKKGIELLNAEKRSNVSH